MADIKGLKMLKGNKSNIERYLIPIPFKKVQQIIVLECETVDKEVEKAKMQIAKTKSIIDNSAKRKQEVLDKYLK